jgi:hypothetical protein
MHERGRWYIYPDEKQHVSVVVLLVVVGVGLA